MDKSDLDRHIAYWLESSASDKNAMENLFISGNYSWSLFLGHLVLEKLLKALIVKNTNNIPPFTHDLSRLAKISGEVFSEEHLDWLDTITTFNISARYEDYKRTFYYKCTVEYSSFWREKINLIDLWIREKL